MLHTTIWDSNFEFKSYGLFPYIKAIATYVLTLELVGTQKKRGGGGGGCKYVLNFHCIAYQLPFLDSVQVYNLFYDLFICL